VVAKAGELAGWTPVLHDLSAGGLAVALAEICIRSGVGASVEVTDWRELFTEAPHRFLAVLPEGIDPTKADRQTGVPVRKLGTVGGTTLDWGSLGSVPLGEVAGAWRSALPRRLT
jgi:phosphoribosylformylglycinamidine synthase